MAAYLKNRTLANTIETFFKKKPNVKNLRLYSSKVFVRIPEQKRLSKWDKKADMGTFVEYSLVGFRVLINNKIVIARNVDIVEAKIKCINLDDDERESNISPSTSTLESFRGNESDLGDNDVFKSENEMNEQESKVEQKETRNKELNVPCKSTRDKKGPVRFPESESYNIFINFSRVDMPCTFEEAINSKDRKNWENVMDNEIECINKNNTWKLVNRVHEK